MRYKTPDRFPTGEPVSAAEIADALQHLHAASDRYLSSLPLDAFVAPQGQKWSPADHVRHLSKSTYALIRALALPRLALFVLFGIQRRPSRSFSQIRHTYRERLAAGVTAGRFAPTPQLPPTDPASRRDHVMTSWRNAASGLHAGIPHWPERSLDRFRLPHPALGRLTVREMLFFTLYHNAHHLNLLSGRIENTEESGT